MCVLIVQDKTVGGGSSIPSTVLEGVILVSRLLLTSESVLPKLNFRIFLLPHAVNTEPLASCVNCAS